jgi:hypothetical protein
VTIHRHKKDIQTNRKMGIETAAHKSIAGRLISAWREDGFVLCHQTIIVRSNRDSPSDNPNS